MLRYALFTNTSILDAVLFSLYQYQPAFLMLRYSFFTNTSILDAALCSLYQYQHS
jgi:hypothetical protein